MKRETEIKCVVRDVAAFRKRLARAGARAAAPAGVFPAGKGKGSAARVHEMNCLFDTPQGGLAKHGQLLRVRVESGARGNAKRAGGDRRHRVILTYKGPAVREHAAGEDMARGESHFERVSRHKVREEVEVEVADVSSLRQILEALGLRGWFRYEKYRTTFRLAASARWARELLIELDETPLGVFVELEGPAEAIDRAAGLLGFTPRDYITKSYLALYLDNCRGRRLTPGDMLFPPQK